MGWEVGESGDVLMLQNTVFSVVEWEGYKVPCQSEVSLAQLPSGSTHSHNVMHFCKSLSLSVLALKSLTAARIIALNPGQNQVVHPRCQKTAFVIHVMDGYIVKQGEKNLE